MEETGRNQPGPTEERMDPDILIANLRQPVSRLGLIENYCRNKTVLDLGCVNHNR